MGRASSRQAKLYEEYHPYGTSAYRSSNGSVEVSARRYRYTGKERDEETGLYYYGARYYACWLGRWTSADPSGIGADGPGLYNYTRGSPVTLTDPNGRNGKTPAEIEAEQDAKWAQQDLEDRVRLAKEYVHSRLGGGDERFARASAEATGSITAEPQALELSGQAMLEGGLFVYSGVAFAVAGMLGADMGSGEQAEARQAAWAELDETNANANTPSKDQIAAMPTRPSQSAEQVLHVTSFMAPGILLKHIARSLQFGALATGAEAVTEHTGASARWWNKGPGVKSVVIGTVPEQSTPQSCMSASGSLLSEGRYSEKQILDIIGDSKVEPKHLSAALNKLEGADVWVHSFADTESEALLMVSKGPTAARLQVPGEVGHSVMIEPLGGGEFLVQDPGIGGTMVVDEGWIARYVTATVSRR